jgi:Raf kinase inhibitor-like YbhB/YbcL family protein
MKTLTICTLVFALSMSTAFAQEKGRGRGRGRGPGGPGMMLMSPDFADGAVIPDEFTQKAQNPPSPQLEWDHVPAGTKSFALIMHDPDVALGKKTDDVLHWMIFNIPGTAKGLPKGVPAEAKMPDGAINAKNLRGGVGYMGPGAPAPGPYHHYTLELFALDEMLPLGTDATRQQVIDAMQGHILAKAVLVGRFHR